MAPDDETDAASVVSEDKSDGKSQIRPQTKDVSRRNFLLGRIRPDPREEAEKAWRGSESRSRAEHPDVRTRPLPSVISWLEDSLDESSALAGSADGRSAQRSRIRVDADRAFPLLRPPGALAESEFLETCTRCGDCIEACQPEAIRKAPERMRAAAETPIIDPSCAPCLLCEDLPCITACEPGALRAEAPSSLGTAHVQAFDCLNRLGTTCSVCVERCPVPDAMTWLGSVPTVDASLCTGCGQCHYACPAPSNAIAIHPNAERPTRDEIAARAAAEQRTFVEPEATAETATPTLEIESVDSPGDSPNDSPDDEPIELPELHDEFIDDQTVARLFRDLGALTRIIEIQEKGRARDYAERLAPDLEEVADRFVKGELRALQIVYVYEDETWCDTMMRQPAGTRVLRMRAPARATGHA